MKQMRIWKRMVVLVNSKKVQIQICNALQWRKMLIWSPPLSQQTPYFALYQLLGAGVFEAKVQRTLRCFGQGSLKIQWNWRFLNLLVLGCLRQMFRTSLFLHIFQGTSRSLGGIVFGFKTKVSWAPLLGDGHDWFYCCVPVKPHLDLFWVYFILSSTAGKDCF